MSSIDAIIDVSLFSKWIGLQTKASHDVFAKQLNEWNYNKDKLLDLSAKCKRFKDAFKKDPNFFKECHKIFHEIVEIEKKINTLLSADSNLEQESYNEILFLKPMFQVFNFLPYVLSIWAFIRIYILPGISLLFPILTLIAPYLIIKFIFNVPMTLSNYMTILNSMTSGNFQGISTESFKEGTTIGLKHASAAIIAIIQGVIQPYWSYTHLKSIDGIIQENGSLILRFREKYTELSQLLSKHGFTFFTCPLPTIENERDATARVILQPAYFKLALKYIGSLEVIMNLSHHNDINPVKWIASHTPVFNISNTFDFNVTDTTNRISVIFSNNRNALLTGPNKGGKSTVLRALSINALLAHTYGCTIGHLKATPFQKMFVCLKPDDLPGSKSRFEREIEFTAHTLKYKEPILIFIDELYHSTNPSDALRSCQIYCKQLWDKPNVVSVISTHLFELVEKAPNTIQKLCCPATIETDGNIRFSYSLQTGICKVSSVDTLLKHNGLLIPTHCV